MFNRKTVSTKELKQLLILRCRVDKGLQKKLEARFQEESGNVVPVKRPEAVVIENMIVDRLAGIIARRLKQDQRTKPLLSPRDFVNLNHQIMNKIEKMVGQTLGVEERKLFDNFMEMVFKNLFQSLRTLVPSRRNLYDEYWRWAEIVHDLATEHNVLPANLLLIENATDEIMRRMLTKRQFITLSKRVRRKLLDVDTLKEIFIQPMLEVYAAGMDDEERCELERKLEADLMPKLAEHIEKVKVITNTLLDEEIERIYGVA